jgi:TonB-linked SusC/RagA family outer membrane protein
MRAKVLKNHHLLKRTRVTIILLLLLFNFSNIFDVTGTDAIGVFTNLSKNNNGSEIFKKKYLLQTVNGKVTNEAGQPLPGVNIVVKGTNIGTVTDIEGNYLLDVPDENAVLVFSFIGYKSQEVPIAQRNVINIRLAEDAAQLEEVVVIGYGEQSRETVTTSVSKLDDKVLENIPYANVASAMQGTLPGVRVQSTSGQPGAAPRVIVRGGTSINNPNGAAPLYVIDGVIRPNMNNIASEDIESMQVLKDAASTAIYGARGSNGVVVITTKSGQPGKTQVTYKYDLTVSEVGRTYNLASARDYIHMSRLGFLAQDKFPDASSRLTGPSGFGTGNDLTNNTAYTTQYLTPENEHKLNEGWESMPDPIDPSKTIIFKDTDWQDVLFQKAISHNHHVNVSGGSDNATFNAGIGYLNSQGVAITTDYERFTFNLNSDLKVNDKLSFFGNVQYSRSIDNKVPNITHTFARYATLPPTAKYKFEDGTLAPGQAFSEANPEYILTNREGENASDNLTLSVGSHFEILPGFSFDPQISIFNVSNDSYSFQPSYLNGPGNLVDNRNASASNYRWRQTQADAVFSYTKSFASVHNLDATAGYSYFGRKESRLSASGRGASTDLIPTLNASGEPTAVSSSITDQVILGYFARVNYNYKYKYLLSLSTRYDGASNLGDNYKWGFFPGVSVGWNLHQEDFWSMFPEDLLRLKLRGSYGINGNIGGLSDFAAQGAYGVGARYVGNAAIQNAIIPNPELKWEESKTLDIGADIGVFNSRINLLFDYYRRITDNLITNLSLPPSTGFGSILTNLGSLENKGFEFELSAQIFENTSDFQWNIAFNAGKVKNKILKLPPNGTENNRVGGVYVWDPDREDYAWLGGLQEGGTMGDLFAFKQIGIYATDEEAQAGPDDELMIIKGKKFGGDVNWLDKDGNGVIDSRDETYVGNIYPVWTGGFTNSFSYKNFSLIARFDYTTGHTIYNFARAFMEGHWKLNMNLTQNVVENSWKEQGDIASLPRYFWYGARGQANISPGRTNSSYYESGDFLALRELTLSYNFSSEMLQKLRINNLRLNVTGNNLHYFTNYKGLNPEEGGRDYGRYPLPRNIIFGANISF